jgi:hypothetical protein
MLLADALATTQAGRLDGPFRSRAGALNPAKGDRGDSDQLFPFRCEPRSLSEAQGRMSAMGYVMKAPLRRRLSRRVNMTARRNPVKAPSNPSVMERLLNVRRPWPVKRNPVYAIVTVHTIARTRISDLPFRWNLQLALSDASCSGNIPLGPFCASSADLSPSSFPDPPHLARCASQSHGALFTKRTQELS